ncbi:DNA helicase INO80 [Schistosoma japonicum]|nr:DNA helicase INO80 [Schistosoma japonicum]
MSISSHASEWSSFSTLPYIIHSAPHANLLNKHSKSYADDDEASGDEKHIIDVILTFVIAIDPEKLLNKEPVVTRPKSYHSGSSSSAKGHNNFMYFHLEYSLLNKDNFLFSTDVVVFSKNIAKIYPNNCSSKLTKPCEFNNTLWIIWTEQIPIIITDEIIIDFWNLTQNGGIRIKCWDQRDKCSIQTRFDRPRSVNSDNKPSEDNLKDDIKLTEFQSVVNALNSYCKHSMNLQMNSSNVDSVTKKCEKTLQPIIKNRTKYMNTFNQSCSSKMKVLSAGQSSLKTDKIQDFIDRWGSCCLVLQTGHLFRINPPRWIVARKPVTCTNYTTLDKPPLSSMVLELDNNFKDILVGIQLSNSLMSTRQRQKFQPIILTIDRLHNLPVTPYRNYDEMRNICEPIRLVTNFSNFWNHQSREYIQDKDIYMDEVQVILTYNIPVPYLRELLQTLPIIIDVYDRVCYKDEVNEVKQSSEYGLFCTEPDDDKIDNYYSEIKEKIKLFILKSNARSLGISDELPLNVIKANINSKQSQYMPCIHSTSSNSMSLHSSINNYNDVNLQPINELITGFHLNDDDFDLFIFETANIQISRNLEMLCIECLNEFNAYTKLHFNIEQNYVKFLKNSQITFTKRLYTSLNWYLLENTMIISMKHLIKQSLLYIRDLLPRLAYCAINRIVNLRYYCQNFSSSIHENLFPTIDMIKALIKEFCITPILTNLNSSLTNLSIKSKQSSNLQLNNEQITLNIEQNKIKQDENKDIIIKTNQYKNKRNHLSKSCTINNSTKRKDTTKMLLTKEKHYYHSLIFDNNDKQQIYNYSIQSFNSIMISKKGTLL